MRLKRIGSCLLAVILSLTLTMPVNSYAASRFTDTAGHWAENYINTAVNEKIITGYPDGKFLPDKAVTRAEFATMVNKALDNSGSESITFTDVPSSEWYYSDVSKALAASYTAGYDDNTFRPNNPITRQEAAVMISRIVPTYGSGGNLKTFSDYRSIADWAYTSLEKVNGKGYIGAYDDGKIHPADQLTRAQTAKIICDIISKESIVSSSPTIDDHGTKLSGKIYTNNVTIDKDLGEDSASIENCVILGNLYVKGGGTDTVTVSNSRIAKVTVDKDSDPVRVLAKGETAIVKLAASEASILQTSSLSGGLFGPGFSNVTINGSADVTLKGSFPNVTISGTKAKVVLNSGSIDKLTVSGRYSDITAESGTSIDTATVNVESYFHGSGTISQMNVNADGITYETKPRRWTIASNADTPTEAEGTIGITFSPKNGATNVYLDSKITITFDSAMRMYDGDSISNSDLDDFIELHKSTSSGSTVGFSATINSTKKIITITPDSKLSESTRYYVIMDSRSLKDEDGVANEKQTIYFNTGTSTQSLTTTYSPTDGTATVSVNPTITIAFSEGVVRYSNGATISSSDSYLKDCIVFKTTNSSGSNVSYSASINSTKKTITITPSSALSLNQKYYIAVVASKLKTSGGTTVPASSVTWTTGYTTPVLNSYTVSPGDTSITATMTPNVAGKIYAVVVPAGSTAPSAAQIAVGQNNSGALALASAKNEGAAASSSITLPSLSGLGSGVTYDVWATLYSNASATYSTPVKQTATTTLPRITLDSITLAPSGGSNVLTGFSASTTNYNVSVPFGTTTVDVTATAASGTVIEINGITTNSTVSISVSPSEITSIKIISSATGATSTTYTINVQVLGNTELDSISINGTALLPGFDTYSSNVNATDTSASISVTTEDANATITIGSSTGIGSYTGTVSLAEGNQQITFTVTSNRITKTYTIQFTRLAP